MLEFEVEVPKTINRFKDKYAMFSNFSPCVVIFEGRTYPTTEHAYQAAKSKDDMFRKTISELPANKAGQTKRLGRKVKLRDDWELIKISVMRRLLMQKFSYDEFRKLLLSTDDSIIIEGNYWHDNYWGDCYCSDCKDIVGKNNLGKLLMKIREIIK
jgi:ribA/ribD-fused uncharacterized protein